jgi:hypothetical protein
MPPVPHGHLRARPAPKRVGVGCVLAALLAGLGLGLLVLGIGVGAFFLLRPERAPGRGGGGSPGTEGGGPPAAVGVGRGAEPAGPAAALGANAQVNEANVGKLWKGMTPDQAQAILGPGKTCTFNDIIAIEEKAARFPMGVRFPGGNLNGETWHRWQNGGMHVFASFLPGKTGVLRLSSLMFFTAHPGGALESGHLIGAVPDEDLDRWAVEHDRRIVLANNPRWKKGPAVRQALVGRWRERQGPGEDPRGWDFLADGTCTGHKMSLSGHTAQGRYRFLNDDHIEMTVAGPDPFNPGRAGVPATCRYRALVDENELILCDEGQGEPIPTPSQFRQR